MGEEVARTVHEKDMNMIRQLTRVVFNKWHSDLLQENLKVVPDLEPQKRSVKASENEDSGNAIWSKEGDNSRSKSRELIKVKNKRPQVGLPKKPTVEL